MRHKFLKINLLAAAMLFFAADFWAQEAPRVRNFSPTDYVGQNQNWSLAQSPEGWLLVANNGGLLEFDGARWRAFFLPNRQTLRAVAIGPAGEVFCGGFAEFGYWKPDAKGQLRYTSLSQNVQADNLQKEEIWHILVADGCVFFQSFSTIYKFDYQKVVPLQPPHAIMFLREVGGRIVFQAIGSGLHELLPDNSFRLIAGTEILADKIVQFLVPDGAGGIWAGTSNDGIWAWADGKMTRWPHPLNADFRKFQLNRAVRLRDGGLAVGTILNGAYLLAPDGSLRAHLNRERGLQNNTVLAMLEDRDGGLWLGLDRGIDRVDLRAPLTFFTDQTGTTGTVYAAALFQNRLFIGTNQGVFSKKWSDPNAVFRLVEGTQGQVWQLQVFDNQLLCGHNAGTFALEAGGARARKISDVTGGWCALAVPGHADALVQSSYTGLVVFRKNGLGDWQFSHRVLGSSEPLRKIAFDAEGYLWGANENRGLVRLRLTDDLGQIQESRSFTTADGLRTDFKLDLALARNRLIINSEQGAMEALTEGGQPRFRPLPDAPTQGKCLPADSPEASFWVERSQLSFWQNASRQPLQISLALVPGFENVAVLAPGLFLFCLENGYALLDQTRLPTAPDAMPLPPKIRWIEASGRDTFAIADGPARFEFSANTHSLRFVFAQPSFGQSPKFSWRLEGFSPEWSAWQTAAEKDFTNLPPGEYRFVVRSDVAENEAVVSFRILPHWYQTGWALAAYCLTAIGLFFLFEKYNRRRLARQRAVLEAEAARELAHQRAEAEREILELEVETKTRDLSNAALNLIRKNEALQHLREEMRQSKGDPNAMHKLTRLIDSHLDGDHDWALFEESFNRVHDDFFKRLMAQFPEMTPGDMRLAAYLKMNLSSKEIAPLLNITVRGVENKRYRLRKKLGLSEDDNLTEFIMAF